MISIVIPVLNEERIIHRNISVFTELATVCDLIFVDGGSVDKGGELPLVRGRILGCEKGRARQMNAGAREARNDILLFLHADNTVSSEVVENIEKEIRQNGAVGGCLTQQIDKKGVIFRIIESQGNNRARRTKIFYGDQGIFVRKDVFERLGGFPEVPIFEDVLFTRKLRHEGKTVVLPDKIMVSARRWEKRGVVRTTFMFNTLLIMFKMGYPLEKTKKLYEDLR
ncbi:MAG: glycosyl transferase [Deltaproteobacteria bacterium CG11_big_fil_rev_8_21_14_0_20_45_16]|nr:MAG: glycosyl transferase [Deltaproteobacteria bacterium CG11_big_fil_rev_8_21_14_0_20_45_16]